MNQAHRQVYCIIEPVFDYTVIVGELRGMLQVDCKAKIARVGRGFCAYNLDG